MNGLPREVLLISEKGGALSRTPKFEAEENMELMQARCHIDENLDAKISYSIGYGGYFYGNMQSLINNTDYGSYEAEMKVSGTTTVLCVR